MQSQMQQTTEHCACLRDAVMLQQQYAMPGSAVQFSVADNVLLVHHARTGRVQLIDVATGGCSAISPAQPFAMALLGVRNRVPHRVVTVSDCPMTHAYVAII